MSGRGTRRMMGWMALAPALGACHAMEPAELPEASASELRADPYVLGDERFVATVQALGVTIADVEGRIAPSCRDPKHLMVDSHARGSTLVQLFASASGDMRTRIDASTGYPERHWSEERDGRYVRAFDVKFEGRHFRYEYDKSGRDYHKHWHGRPATIDGDALHDLHTAGLLMRGWRPRSPGDEAHFRVVLGRRLWSVDLTYRGPDVVLQDDGDARPALHIDGTATKRRRGKSGRRKVRTFELWVSRDSKRAPLRLIADTKFGLLRVDITRHEVRRDGCFDVDVPPQGTEGARPLAGDLDAPRERAQVPAR